MRFFPLLPLTGLLLGSTPDGRPPYNPQRGGVSKSVRWKHPVGYIPEAAADVMEVYDGIVFAQVDDGTVEGRRAAFGTTVYHGVFVTWPAWRGIERRMATDQQALRECRGGSDVRTTFTDGGADRSPGGSEISGIRRRRSHPRE